MERPMRLASLDELLAHEGFVRALARKLVTDEARADDLVQSAYLAALSKRPSAGPLRSFFATIVRNAARQTGRGERRRERRERDSATPESLPSVADAMAAESARRAVIDAVFALDEPWRETLVLRYLDGLSRGAIAKRMGVGVETIHTRLQRGLDLLRSRLDTRHDGERRRWSLALLPLAARDSIAWPLFTSAVMHGMFAMSMKSKFGIVAALACVAAALWIETPQAHREHEPHAESSESRLAPPEVRSDSTPRVEIARESVAPEIEALTDPIEPRSAACGELIVEVVGDGGAPIPGVTVELFPSGGSPRLSRPQRVVADVSGRAVYPKLDPGRYLLQGDRGGHAAADVIGGESTSCVLSLANAITIEGRVVDVAGEGVSGADVYLTPHGQWGEDYVVARSGAKGEFRIDGVLGPFHVGARKSGYAPAVLPFVIADRGTTRRTLTLELGPEGGAIEGRVIDPFGNAVAVARVVADAGRAEMIFPKGGAQSLARSERWVWSDATGQFRIEGLAVGDVPLAVRAAGFAPASLNIDIEAGGNAEVVIRLEPGASIAGVVRDAAGAPLADVSVSAGPGPYLDATFTTSGKDGTYRLEDVAVGDLTVHARRDGTGDTTKRVSTTTGIELAVDLMMDVVCEMRGRVFDESGLPVAQATVAVQSAAGSGKSFSGQAECDADGAFAIAGCPTSALELIAWWPRSPMLAAVRLPDVRAGAQDLVVILPAASKPTARITGKVADNIGNALAEAHVIFTHESSPSGTMVLTKSDGSFASPRLPEGKFEVSIITSTFAPWALAPIVLLAGESRDVGMIRIGNGGRLVVDLEWSDELESQGKPSPSIFFEREDDDTAASIEQRGEQLVAESLQPGRYRLVLSGPLCVAQSVTVDIGEGLEVRRTIELRTGTRVTLAASYAGRESLVRFEVRDEAGGLRFMGRAYRGEDRVFVLPIALDRGDYTFVVRAGSRASDPRSFTVGEDPIEVKSVLD
jgi:RNA polymerase sigma factor (sigma-70 family)